MNGWIGVDLDGTLAEYHGWQGDEHVGPPIPAMVDRVRAWLAEGRQVKIFTARVARADPAEQALVSRVISEWLLEHVGVGLPITCVKDFGMVELWDDRAVQVELNTGRRIGCTSRS